MYHSKLSCWKGGSQLGPTLGSPCGLLLSRFLQGEHGHDLLRNWIFGLSSTNHHYVPNDHATWVDGCRVPSPGHQAVSSPGDLTSGPWWWPRTSRGTTAQPLRCRRCQSNRLGPMSCLMEHGITKARTGHSHDDVIKWKHLPRYWPFVRESTGHRWILLTKASDAELWCFFDLRLNKRSPTMTS